MTPPESSELILEETEKKEVKQELENNRLVKKNKIFETNMEITERIIENYEAQNIDGKYDDKIKALEDEMKENKDIWNKSMQSYEDMTKDMPIIPMGENTHKKNKLGFSDRYGHTKATADDTQIKMSKALQADLKRSDKSGQNLSASTAQVLAVRNAWNNLSDEQRNLIGTLNITKLKGTVATGARQAGSWNNERGILTMNINDKFTGGTVRKRFSTVQHEVGHAEFHKLMVDSPEKTNKFIDIIMSDDMKSTPISTYASKYLNTDELTEKLWAKRIEPVMAQKKRIKKLGLTPEQVKDFGITDVSDKQISDKKKQFFKAHEEWARTIYANETHSKLSEIVHGTSTAVHPSLWTTHPDKPREAHKNLQKYFKAYQELHDT